MIDIEVVPQFDSNRCRYLALVIGLLFNLFPLILFLVVILVYDLYFGLGSLIVGYIFTSVFISKVRQSFIPFEQNEFDYDNFQIARFYTKKNFC